MGGAFGLDFGAVASFAEHTGTMTPLLAAVLPDIERVLLSALRNDDGAEPEEMEPS